VVSVTEASSSAVDGERDPDRHVEGAVEEEAERVVLEEEVRRVRGRGEFPSWEGTEEGRRGMTAEG